MNETGEARIVTPAYIKLEYKALCISLCVAAR